MQPTPGPTRFRSAVIPSIALATIAVAALGGQAILPVARASEPTPLSQNSPALTQQEKAALDKFGLKHLPAEVDLAHKRALLDPSSTNVTEFNVLHSAWQKVGKRHEPQVPSDYIEAQQRFLREAERRNAEWSKLPEQQRNKNYAELKSQMLDL